MLLSFAYQYDGNGNRTAKVGEQTGAAWGGITSEITAGNNATHISYRYDVRGQLLEERHNGASVCYAYDRAGNRIRRTDARGEIRYLYNEKNQLLSEEGLDGKKLFSYDRQGGIIEEKNPNGIRLFSYNSRHQQTRVETENGNVQENRYDAEGLRFELLENGRRTSFVYHNGELLHEKGDDNQNQTSYHLGAGIDAFRRGQELSYYHRDEQLSTAFITDKSGSIRNSYQYDAFGAGMEATGQLSNRIRYTGQQYDDLMGQYYLRARYYNPVLGRFMQEDTYWGDGLNLYAYCGNNPVVYYDPSGYATGNNSGSGCNVQDNFGNTDDQSQIEQDIQNITNKYENLQCVECANEVQAYLESKGLHGVRVTIENGGTLGLRDSGLVISQNGTHVGIDYNGTVYDNLFKKGIPASKWLSSFVSILKPSVRTDDF